MLAVTFKKNMADYNVSLKNDKEAGLFLRILKNDVLWGHVRPCSDGMVHVKSTSGVDERTEPHTLTDFLCKVEGLRPLYEKEESELNSLAMFLIPKAYPSEFGGKFDSDYDFALSDDLNEKIKTVVTLLDEVRFKLADESCAENFLSELNQGTKRITDAVRRLDQDPIV